MFLVNVVTEVVKAPRPVPVACLLLLTVGAVSVFQTTPFSETAAPPSLVTSPPNIAEVIVIEDDAIPGPHLLDFMKNQLRVYIH